MKKILIALSVSALLATATFAQETRKLPAVKVETLKGSSFDISLLENNGNPIVISFWATWCKPCKKELNTIAEVYEDWQDETKVKLVAISIDDTRSKMRVAPYVNSSDWDYEVYLDPNSNLKRAMGVSTVPHTFLLNGKGEIVWQHRGYVDGDEEILYKEIIQYAK
jgi:thiol-disulfide isomerase/thioredoxin|tara:strand:+ start:647 stop:1144 length:498 start_codon:yes stop_codon:yes gene_type:complete